MGIVERSGIWECDDAIVEVRVRIWSPPRVTWGISLSILEPGAEETCAILPHIGTVAFGFSGRVFFSGGGRRFSRLVAKFLATMDSGIFFVHSVDLGMFGRVPATSLQTVASMCFFPRTAPRRAQVWARPVGAGGQQRQIPHVRRSHPGLGCLGSPFRSFNFDLRFLFRGLRAYTHPGLLCRSLARSLSFSVHPLHSGLARRVLFAADRRPRRSSSFRSHVRFPIRRALHLCPLLASHPGGGGPANGPHPLPLVLGRLGPASRLYPASSGCGAEILLGVGFASGSLADGEPANRTEDRLRESSSDFSRPGRPTILSALHIFTD